MFKFLKIRRENKNEQLRRHYQQYTIATCETCKYCYTIDRLGEEYRCFYNDPDFSRSKALRYVCKQYKPERKFKKYLEGKYEPIR